MTSYIYINFLIPYKLKDRAVRKEFSILYQTYNRATTVVAQILIALINMSVLRHNLC